MNAVHGCEGEYSLQLSSDRRTSFDMNHMMTTAPVNILCSDPARGVVLSLRHIVGMCSLSSCCNHSHQRHRSAARLGRGRCNCTASRRALSFSYSLPRLSLVIRIPITPPHLSPSPAGSEISCIQRASASPIEPDFGCSSEFPHRERHSVSLRDLLIRDLDALCPVTAPHPRLHFRLLNSHTPSVGP